MNRLKHIFVVNPYSGKNDTAAEVICEAMKDRDDWEIYRTVAPKDATRFVRERASTGEELRFYACGGDGTIKEVTDGVIGFPNASMSVYPVGSGNDFVKYYGGSEPFLDVKALVEGENRRIDAIETSVGGYSLNIVNFGFDTYVVRVMEKVKRKKFLGGKNAYTVGIIKALISAMKNRARVLVDGEEICSDSFLLCTVANGQYVGGSYRCAPLSLNDDGYLEVCLAKPLSRLTFLKLVSVYKNGKHLDDPRFEKYIVYRRCKKVEVFSDEGFAFTVDGEIVETTHFTAEVREGAVSFGVPKGAECIIKAPEKEPVLK